jgi:hypothetical protein
MATERQNGHTITHRLGTFNCTSRSIEPKLREFRVYYLKPHSSDNLVTTNFDAKWGRLKCNHQKSNQKQVTEQRGTALRSPLPTSLLVAVTDAVVLYQQ